MLRASRVGMPAWAVLLVWVGPLAAEPWPVERGPSREPAPYRYDPAVWKRVPADFLDDAPACILYAAGTHLIEPDGTIETITHEITRPGSRKAVEKLGEFRGITFDPAHEKLTLNVARLHKKDGKVVEVEPRHVHLRDVATDYLVYAADRQLIISFPALEVGDVLEVKWTTRGKNPEHHGHFFNRYSFGDLDYPIVLDELRVRVPAGKSFKHACAGGDLRPRITEEGRSRLYRWSASECRPILREEDRPSKEELRPQVACSTFATWAEVGAWKKRLREHCWECTPDVKQVVAEVTRGLASPRDRARALAYWVRRNVRYVSAGARHDYTPHRPGEVLVNRQGDCKDTSQLLAVMLREAGVPAALVTLGCVDDGQVLEEVPSPWGTHGILLATIDGKDHWIDTTATLAGWDFLPRSCRDRVCYVTDDDGIRLMRTPPLTADEHRFEQSTEVTIAADGSSRAYRTEHYLGLAALNQRDRWLEAPAGEQRRVTVQRLLDSNSRTHLNRQVIDEPALEDFDRPVTADVEFSIPGQFAGQDRDASFTDSRVWNYLLGYNLDPGRQLPLELYGPVDTRHTFVFRAPAGFEFDGLPRTREVRSKWGTFTRKTQWLGKAYRGIRVEFHLRLEKWRVEPADFEAFRTFHRDVGDNYRVWIGLERVWHRKHLAEMEALCFLVRQDAFASALLAEHHLHLGDRSAARRVLTQARHYRPDDLALLELSVKAAAGPEEAEKAQRELVTRHPTDPTQSIALAAMLIDRDRGELAEPLLRELASSAPPAARGMASYQLARSAFKQERTAEALKHLEDASAFDAGKSQRVAVEMLRGRSLEKLDRPADALQAYRKAHEADPSAADALVAVIESALAGDDRLLAGEYLRKYALLVGDRVTGLNRAAEYALRLGWSQEAYDLALRARDVGFNEATQRILGLVHLQRGEPDRAVFHLDRADPGPAVLEGLIRAHLAMGNVPAAERHADRAARITPMPEDLKQAVARTQSLVARREEVLKLLAADAAGRKKWLTAIDYLACAEEARRQGRSAGRVAALAALADADLGPVRSFQALLALERGQLTEALTLAEEALGRTPADPRAWYVRGKVRLERLALGALADLERAAALSGERDAETLHALALAQHAAGRAGDAVRTLAKAVALKADPAWQSLLDRWKKETPRGD